ncbi:MAG: phosphoribosylglycinamide formyltransferase [Methylococcales bacterium]
MSDYPHTKTMNIPRVIALISGRGSNLQSLIQHAQDYRIETVISNKPNAAGLELARNAGIATTAFERKAKGDTFHRQQIYQTINQINPDFIALAGFMEILDSDFVMQWEGKLINIHPSLLPNFRGLQTHQRALERFNQSNGQQNQHGCSVHFVDVTVDTGPIIAQAACTIKDGDDEERLAQRVLEDEHRLFPWVMNNIASNNISYNNAEVNFSEQARTEALQYQFIIKERA